MSVHAPTPSTPPSHRRRRPSSPEPRGHRAGRHAAAGPELGGRAPASDRRRREGAVPQRPPAHRPPRRRPARPDDAGGEDRPDGPGRAAGRRRRPVADHRRTSWAASCRAAARRRRRTRPRRGRTWSTRYQAAALDTRLGIPLIYGVDSVHGHGNLHGRHRLPAQHRPRRHPRPEAGREDRRTSPRRRPAPPGRSGRSRRASAWPATTAGAAPTSSFGEDPALVRAMETVIDGLQGRRGQLDDADRVLATAKHFAGDGLTTYDASQGRHRAATRSTRASTRSRGRSSRSSRSRRTRPRSAAPRRLGDAVVLQRRLDRGRPRQPGEDARQQGAHHRRPQGAAWASTGLVISDWRAIRQIPRRLRDPGEDLGATPASTCSWSRTPATPAAGASSSAP